MRRLHDDADGGHCCPGWTLAALLTQTQTPNLVSPPEADAFSPLLLSFGAELLLPGPPGARWPCSLRVWPLAPSGPWLRAAPGCERLLGFGKAAT